MLGALDDRFGRHPNYLLNKPYYFATFSDPRYSCIYFKESFGSDNVKEEIIHLVKTELESMEDHVIDCEIPSNSKASQESSFWAEFEEKAQNQSSKSVSVEAEIQMWSGVSRPHKQTSPIHAMEGLKQDFSRIYKLFCKYSIYPATQNKDEKLFSMVARNTGSQCQRIKVETIEKKVVIRSAVQRHGFILA